MKTENMTFSEALEAMKQGYKVRIKDSWGKTEYLVLDNDNNTIVDEDGEDKICFTKGMLEATNWEIYTDTKPEPQFEIGELVMMKKEDYDKWYPKFFAKSEDGWDGTRYCAISETTLYKQCAKFDKDIVFTNKPAKE